MKQIKYLFFVFLLAFIGIQTSYAHRYFDSWAARWCTPDPLMQKYPDLSPYAYCADNPLKYIDPNGKEIVLSGSVAFQNTSLAALQKITNDKLTLKNGVVYVNNAGGQNSDKKLNFGTALIRDLGKIGDGAHTVTITKSEGGNASPPKSTEDAQIKGKGSDTNLEWNPNNPDGGRDVNGNTERPSEIGLGHELIHAQDNSNGTVNIGITGVTDPDNDGNVLLENYEVKARKGENEIRKEQGLPQRMEPLP